MTIGIVTATRNSRVDEINTATNVSGPGALRVYNGTRPATGGTATTLLAEFTMSNPAFVTPAVAGVMTANSISATTIAASGTATWFRIVDGAGSSVLDGSVGLVASGADLEFDTVTFVSGRAITVDSLVLTEGNP